MELRQIVGDYFENINYNGNESIFKEETVKINMSIQKKFEKMENKLLI